MTAIVGVVLVGHGRSAEALLEAAEGIVGPIPAVRAVGFAPGQPRAELAAGVRAAAVAVDAGSGVVLALDLRGSTPDHVCGEEAASRGARGAAVVCGLSLPMLLKLSTEPRAGASPAALATALAATAARAVRVEEGTP